MIAKIEMTRAGYGNKGDGVMRVNYVSKMGFLIPPQPLTNFEIQ